MDLFNRSGARLKLIASLNLEQFVNRAVDDFGLKPENIDAAMREYRHFLYLAYWNRRMEQSTMVVPTVNADKIWHSHILFTRDYREMCDRVFGRYLDHQPGLKEGTSAHTSAMRHTRDVHKRIRELGKEPGFDDSYFAFLDPKPTPRPKPVARSSSSSRSRQREENAGSSCSDGPTVIFAGGSPAASEHAHASPDFGGGNFGGGGASGGWGSSDSSPSSDSSSSSSSDSGGGSSCGGGGGCGGD